MKIWEKAAKLEVSCSKLQSIIESYNEQNSMVLTQKQAHRWMEQNREAWNKHVHFWSINLWQRREEYSKDSLFNKWRLEKLDGYM